MVPMRHGAPPPPHPAHLSRPSRGRRRRQWLTLAFVLLPGLPACEGASGPRGDAGETAEAVAPSVSDSAGVEIREYPAGILSHPSPRQLAPEPEVVIGVLEGPEAYQWTRPVAAVRLARGGFAVAEQSPGQIRIFDDEGTHLRTLGAAGDGPGEFRRLAGLALLPGDTLLAWDAGSARLSWFSVEGDLLRDRALRSPGGIQGIPQLAADATGGIFAFGSTEGWEAIENRGRIREAWRIVPLNGEGEAGPPGGTVRGTERILHVNRTGPGDEGIVSIEVQGRWWWGEGFVRGSRGGVWSGDRLLLEARHFAGGGADPGGAPDRIVRVLAPAQPFSRSLIDSLHAAELARSTDPEQRRRLEADMELREYPESVPPVEAIFSDRAGGVWLGLTPLPRRVLPSGGVTAIERWLVPEPAEARGILTLPPMSHPLWADDEGLLLLRNDPDLGVAYVEWVRFRQGTPDPER